MRKPGTFLRQPIVIFVGSLFVLLGAGMAGARVQGGPPWAQDAGEEVGGGEVLIEDPELVQADVEEYFATFENDCGAAFLGEYDLGEEDTLAAFGDLVARLDEAQTSHGVQSVRVLLGNCEDHPNDGLMNALYHHGLNWVKHYEHELWLQEKFADKWPEGKPGNSDHGKPEKAEKVHGNPHTSSSSASSHGNGNGHST